MKLFLMAVVILFSSYFCFSSKSRSVNLQKEEKSVVLERSKLDVLCHQSNVRTICH